MLCMRLLTAPDLVCFSGEKFWANFCTAVGRPIYWHDGTLVGSARQRTDADLHRDLKELFGTRRRDEWVELFNTHDVIGTPVLDIDEISDLDHFRQRRLAEADAAGPVPAMYDPIRWVDDDSRLG